MNTLRNVLSCNTRFCKLNGPFPRATCRLIVITQSAISQDVQTEIASKIATDKVLCAIAFIATNDENLLEDKTLDEILGNQTKFAVGKTSTSLP